MKSINPATGQVVREYPESTPSDIEAALPQAAEAFAAWQAVDLTHRAGVIQEAARILRRRKDEWAILMTTEMGKPITQARAEVEKCAVCCEHFAEHAGAYLARESIATEAVRSYVRYEPLGPILAIMPWNFPFWQAVRFAAPALMAGNVAVLKHASNVPGCALALADLFREAGAPPGVFQTLLISGATAEGLIAHSVIRAVTLTGSTQAGVAVASAAGKALKKSVLELGGSDPFIVLPDVDIQAVAAQAASARCMNSGQSCIAAKRFIVHGSVLPAFEEAFTAAMRAQKVGDPLDDSTQIGPLARKDLVTALQAQVDRSVVLGARLTTGGIKITGPGYFYPPTVLTAVTPEMPAFHEETFGPVAVVISARDTDEAIRLANQSSFGLGASLWTRDLALAERLAGRIEAGCVFVNGLVKSDPRLPFGGVKQSGYGRELSAAGIREFVNIKTVWVGVGI